MVVILGHSRVMVLIVAMLANVLLRRMVLYTCCAPIRHANLHDLANFY